MAQISTTNLNGAPHESQLPPPYPNCPRCGAGNDWETVEEGCNACGSPLQPMCGACGGLLPHPSEHGSFGFCPGCGRKLHYAALPAQKQHEHDDGCATVRSSINRRQPNRGKPRTVEPSMGLNKPPKSRRGEVASARLTGRALGILIALCGVAGCLVWIIAELPLVPAVAFVVFSTLVAGTVKGHFEAEAGKIEDEERNANKDWQFNRLVESKVQAIDRATQFEHERSQREEERKVIQEERERQRQEWKNRETEWADTVIRTKVKVRELLERHNIHPREIVVARTRRIFIHHDTAIPLDILRLIESKVEMAANYIKVHVCPFCNEVLEATHADSPTCPFCRKSITGTAKPVAQSATSNPERGPELQSQPEPELRPEPETEMQQVKLAKMSRPVQLQDKPMEQPAPPPPVAQAGASPAASAKMNQTATPPITSIVQPVKKPIQDSTKTASVQQIPVKNEMSQTKKDRASVNRNGDLQVGAKVTIRTGPWKGISGTVHYIEKKKRCISVQLNNGRVSVPIDFVSPSESERKPAETLEVK